MRTRSRRKLEQTARVSGRASKVWAELAPFIEDGTPEGDQLHARVRGLAEREMDRAVEATRQADLPWWKRRGMR
ncbi:hypothetical protein [Streptomyces sp. NPDC049879]|uniref:hypothetical protein n=1 Tax=Streptomyces sp. NPDC049879 TaxID=3365598 RepID=UPI0037BCE900